jgi:hypothetical protein
MMNNFEKVYTTDTLKRNRLVTLVAFPMEESIMVPVAQIIDLMKRGENVIFFSFNHDSIKVNEFLVPALKAEPNPEKITGGLSIIDTHQVPTKTPAGGTIKLSNLGMMKFIEEKVVETKKALEREGKFLNFIFIDLPNNMVDDEETYKGLVDIKFTQDVTSVLVKALEMPIITAAQMQNKKEGEKIMDDFMDKSMTSHMINESAKLVANSDMIFGIKRKKINFWTKLINFLLFWRKRNNFTLQVLKNRSGSDGQTYRVNIDMDEFKTEIL